MLNSNKVRFIIKKIILKPNDNIKLVPTELFNTNRSVTMTENISNCSFCDIVTKKSPADILYEDDDILVFKDIKPASRFHFLTIPKKHIDDVKYLTIDDKELVEKMYKIALEVLAKNDLAFETARLGYHWPPFRTVRHLHLHTIAPESEMGFFARFMFKSDSYWFVSQDFVLSRLQRT